VKRIHLIDEGLLLPWRGLEDVDQAALQVEVAPAQVQDLAAPAAGEQVGQDQGAQAQAGRGLDRNRGQEPGHLLGAQTPGPSVGLPPRRPDSLRGVVCPQAFGAGPAKESDAARPARRSAWRSRAAPPNLPTYPAVREPGSAPGPSAPLAKGRAERQSAAAGCPGRRRRCAGGRSAGGGRRSRPGPARKREPADPALPPGGHSGSGRALAARGDEGGVWPLQPRHSSRSH
jgi:hypothetical protein